MPSEKAISPAKAQVMLQHIPDDLAPRARKGVTLAHAVSVAVRSAGASPAY